MPTEREKMCAGELYFPDDPELIADRVRAERFMKAYNEADAADRAGRGRLLKDHLAEVGQNVTIRPVFSIDYGYNIYLADRVFMNFGCVILDVCAVRIGEGTAIGPNVLILTADHPRQPDERATGHEYGRPVTIGKNVWIGGGAMILPGVTIGEHAIIGAGSVVNKDVPAGETWAGNPARKL